MRRKHLLGENGREMGGGGVCGTRFLWPSWEQSCRKVACPDAVAPHEWPYESGHAIVGVL